MPISAAAPRKLRRRATATTDSSSINPICALSRYSKQSCRFISIFRLTRDAMFVIRTQQEKGDGTNGADMVDHRQLPRPRPRARRGSTRQGASARRHARKPEQLADLVERYGDKVAPVALDVTNEAAARAAVRRRSTPRPARRGGEQRRLWRPCPIEDTSLEDFRAQIGPISSASQRHQGGAAGPGQRAPATSSSSRRGWACGTDRPWRVRGGEVASKACSEVLAKEAGPLGVKVTIVEPGGFRTGLRSASTSIHDGNPAYAATVGAVARFQREYDVCNPAIRPRRPTHLKIAGLAEPPLRLPLGSDAVRAVDEAERAVSRADKKWRRLSMSTDFREVLAT